MAYPIVSAPYGLKPVNLIGGQAYAGSTRMFKIASGYPANILYGDIVTLVTAGTIQKETGTTTVSTNGVAGVFLGCTYTDPSTKQPRWSQYWPSGTVASDAQAYVVDDPDALFKVAAVSGTTVIAYYAQSVVGSNVALVQNTGSTNTGDSAVAIDGTSAAATATLPIRIVQGVPDTANASGEFCEFIVKFNMPNITGGALVGGHSYYNPAGI
jgi:hypothetical protein